MVKSHLSEEKPGLRRLSRSHLRKPKWGRHRGSGLLGEWKDREMWRSTLRGLSRREIGRCFRTPRTVRMLGAVLWNLGLLEFSFA
jgi:hypothetical protein